MKKILYRMNGIARELFVEVACNGLSPTKAVEKASEVSRFEVSVAADTYTSFSMGTSSSLPW